MACVYSGFHGECQLWEEGVQMIVIASVRKALTPA